MSPNNTRDPWRNLVHWWATRNVSRRVVVGAGVATVFATAAQLLGEVGLKIVAAAALAFCAGVIYPPNHQPRYRHATGVGSLVVGLAAVSVLAVSLPSTDQPSSSGSDTKAAATPAPTTPPPGVTAQVDYGGENAFGCQPIIFTQKPNGFLPPSSGAAPDGNAVQAWGVQAGGVDGAETHIRINLQGTTDTAVVFQSMEVHVLDRQDPGGGFVYTAQDGCGGSVTPRVFAVDLDAPQPKAVAQDGADGSTVVPAADFPISVSNSDPEVFLVDAKTADCDCSWELILHWTSGGKLGQTVVRDANDQPFITHAIPDGARQYQPDGSGGWFYLGQAKTEHTMLATQGWNTMYPEYKPKKAFLSGDSTFEIKDMTWSTWDSDTAIGDGIGVLNDCVPSCADGKPVGEPIRISLSKPDTTCSPTFFTQVDVEWPDKVPAGAKRKYTWISEAPTCS